MFAAQEREITREDMTGDEGDIYRDISWDFVRRQASWALQQGFSGLDMWFSGTCAQFNKIYITKDAYHRKSSLRDCKELSLLRPSQREFRPWSVSPLQLRASQQINFSKSIYDWKSRWMDCKELNALRLWPRLLRPWSVIWLPLWEGQ